ncbi:MAG: NAD(P)/FAD-dependent oxidoreductase [Desulfatirhabdiaceae bacterium]
MSPERHDVLIAGTGPAGMTAAVYARRFGLNTVVFGDTPGGNLYMIEKIDNLPGYMDGVGGTEFGMRLFQQAQIGGAQFTMSRIERLGHDNSLFHCTDSNGQTRSAPVAILATGRMPVGLEVENRHLKGVHHCSLCDGPLYRNTNATLAVIGSSNAAAQHVMTLSRIAEKVLLLYRSEKAQMDYSHQERIAGLKNVEVRSGTEILAYKGLDLIEALEVRSGDGKTTEIPVDGVFAAIGWLPNTRCLDFSVKMTQDGYIQTDSRLMTSVPGLFAAGDVRNTDMYQVLTGCADGARAAKHAADFLG